MQKPNKSSTIPKLHSFIIKLIEMLEFEIDKASEHREQSEKKNNTMQSLTIQKSVTTLLAKLVVLTVQLNKLSKDEEEGPKEVMPETDKAIITRFLEKFKDNH